MGALVVGVSGEDIAYAQGTGAFHIPRRSISASQFRHQDSLSIVGFSDTVDFFSDSLAIGDFKNDGYFDIAARVPEEGTYHRPEYGVVNVLYGSSEGIGSSGNHQAWS
ncbi:MAG: hypothetical protein ABIJ50_00890 [Pseudomonadota bacterium]